MTRRIFNIATTASAVMLALTLSAWALGRRVNAVYLTTRWADQSNTVRLTASEIGWCRSSFLRSQWSLEFHTLYETDPPTSLDPVRRMLSESFGPAGKPASRWQGQALQSRRWSFPAHSHIGVHRTGVLDATPVLHIVAVLSVLPIVWLARRAVLYLGTRRVRALGRCRRCGYDLAGNMSGVCPECGTTVAEMGQTGQRVRGG